jgi:hypothetical protein
MTNHPAGRFTKFGAHGFLGEVQYLVVAIKRKTINIGL